MLNNRFIGFYLSLFLFLFSIRFAEVFVKGERRSLSSEKIEIKTINTTTATSNATNTTTSTATITATSNATNTTTSTATITATSTASLITAIAPKITSTKVSASLNGPNKANGNQYYGPWTSSRGGIIWGKKGKRDLNIG
ncbi:hypothetical protein G9A89_020265, partial [Geosiphon pyriformis]